MTKRETTITKDIQNKKLNITRTFDAPLDAVWKAWTTPEILDQWWAPKPWRAETKSMDFKVGGHWLYSMVGPNSERSFNKDSYETIIPEKRIANNAIFCDVAGKMDPNFPVMHWVKNFDEEGNETTVKAELSFDNEADMETLIKMGFQEGFKMGLDNLAEYLDKK